MKNPSEKGKGPSLSVRSILLSVFMWGILTMLTNGSVPAGERIRIALPGIPTLRTITAENKTRTALALYLHERLNESDSVELVNGARANYLFSTLRRDIGTAASDQYFAAFNRYLPVDAIVTYRVVVGTVQVTVYTHRGRKEHTFPSATGGLRGGIFLADRKPIRLRSWRPWADIATLETSRQFP